MPNIQTRSEFLIFRGFLLVFFMIIIWSFGLASFVVSVDSIDQTKTKADGIVVLTGGTGRIDEGFKVLTAGRSERLLISGVDQNINNETILSVFDQDQALWDCCVDAGRLATNTRTNALETAAWAKEHGYSSIILITSDYHMPRSLNVFQNYAKELTLVPHPVKTGVSPIALALEYDKYLFSLVRIDLKN